MAAVTFGANASIVSVAALDSVTVVALWRDSSTQRVNAIVGAVSGTAISFGSAKVAEAANADAESVSVAALTSTTFLACWVDTANHDLSAAVGTVSGLDITFGAIHRKAGTMHNIQCAALASTLAVCTYFTGTTAQIAALTVSGTDITFGAANNPGAGGCMSVAALTSTTFIHIRRDGIYGDRGKAKVGAVVGAALTFGANAVFSENDNDHPIGDFGFVCALDGTHVAIAYTPFSGGSVVIVGFISGTTVSFGTRAAFNSDAAVNLKIEALDSTHFVVAADEGGVLKARVGTVSGTAVTFGAAQAANSGAAWGGWVNGQAVAKLTSSKWAVVYADTATGNGRAEIFTDPPTVTTTTVPPTTTTTVPPETVALSDSVALTDAVAVSAGKAAGDSVALADSASLAAVASLSDSVGLADSPSIVAFGPGAAFVSDAVGLADEVGLAAGVAARASDSVSLADSASRAAGGGASDSVSLADAASLEAGIPESDAVALSDSAAAALGKAEGESDALAVADDMAASVVGKAAGDAVALSDGVAVSVGKAAGDAVALSDREKAAWTVAGGPPTTTAAIIAQKEDDHQRVVLWDLFAGSADFAAADFHADIAQRLNLSLPTGDVTVALTGGGYSVDYDAADDTLNVGCDESDPSGGECHAELGSPTGSERGRLLVANLYYCARAALLTEVEQFLDMASPANVEFFVYEALDDAALAGNIPRPGAAPEPGTSASYGVIDPGADDADERHRRARSDFQSAFGLAARSAAGFSAGMRFRSSGPIDAELRQGRFYLIGAAWTGGGTACFWGGGHPAGTPFGRSLGGLRLAHDGDLPATLSPTTDASLARPLIDGRAYHQRLTLDGRGVGRGAAGATLFVIDADGAPDGMRVGRGGPGDLRVGTINATGAGVARILTNVRVGQVIGGPDPEFFDGSIDPPGPGPETRYAVKVNRAVYRTRRGSPARCRCHRRFYREPEGWREFRTEADALAYFDALEPVARAAIGVTEGGLDATGCRGGPFAPDSAEFRVANSGAFPVAWSASSDAPWVRLSVASGSLPNPGDEATVEASLDGAESLCTGVHEATVTIANETNGVGTAARAFRLEVRGRPSPEVEPAGDFVAEGPPGGPFGPPSARWILRNADGCPMRWRADWSAGWLAVSPAGGTLPGGGEVAVEASIGPLAGSLPPDRYGDRVVFRNLTSGRGLVGRGVSLFIRPPF